MATTKYDPDQDTSGKDGEYSNPPAWPNGEYQVIIGWTDYKVNSKNTGHNAVLRFDRFDGTKPACFQNLSVDNPNHTAMGIARAAIGDIRAALGMPEIHGDDKSAWMDEPGFLNQLMDKPLYVTVTSKPGYQGRGDANGMVNEITGYRSVHAQSRPPRSPPPPDPDNLPF